MKIGVPLCFLAAGLLGSLSSAQQPSPAAGAASPSTQGAPAPGPGTSAVPPDKVVLKVADEQMTKADLDFLLSSLSPQVQQTVATQGRRGVGEQYALMVVLSQQAVNDHLDSAPAFIQQIAIQRRQMLAQAEYTHLASVTTVSPEEVSQYYSTHQAEFDSADVRQVVVRKKLEGAKEGTPGLAAPEARARVESIRKALAAGTDIKKVAQDFQAPNDVMIDLEPRHIRHGQLLPSMDKAAFELKDGELSQPLDIPQAFVLIQAVGHHHSELKEASPGIDKTIRQQKLDAAVAELKKKATVWMDEEYFKPPQAPPTLTTVPSVENRAPRP